MGTAELHSRLDCGSRQLAYRQQPGSQPGILFLGGFLSDMTGTKAEALGHWCQQRGYAYTRFDYSGHGASSGRFEEGTIGAWLEDARNILEEVTEGPQILVGSSMGGWISLLLALAKPQRIQGVLTIACATDFTSNLIRPALTDEQMATLLNDGKVYVPSPYNLDPYPITRQLLDEGELNCLLDSPIAITCPVRMLHGKADQDVPWKTSQATLNKIESSDKQLTLIDDGDHRLSKSTELELITNTLESLIYPFKTALA